MIKASHNTFSYYKPKQWYLRPFAFVAKCQSKSLAEQVNEGIKVFDLRLRQDKDGKWVIAHNAFVYVKGFDTIIDILQWLDIAARYSDESIYVRVLHEVRNEKQAYYNSTIDFWQLCKQIKCECSHIRFFGGQRTMDWVQEYHFPEENNINYIELHASRRWPKWFHWWPWLYAWLYNETNEFMYEDKDVVAYMDFI